MLRAQAREADPTPEEWAGSLRARWRAAEGAARSRLEGRLRFAARAGWAPAQALLGESLGRAGGAARDDEPLEALALGLDALVADPDLALTVWRGLAEAAHRRWARGRSGELALRAIQGFSLPARERAALAEEATLVGLRTRPAGGQRTGEISPSGRVAALAGAVLGLGDAAELRSALEACFQLVTGLLGPEEMLHVARGVVPTLLQAEFDLA